MQIPLTSLKPYTSASRHTSSMPTRDKPNVPNPQLPSMAASSLTRHVDRPVDDTEREAPLVSPGLIHPNTRNEGTTEPLAHATYRQLAADSGESESEDEDSFMTVEEQLLPVWEQEGVTSERRQCQLVIRARDIVANHVKKFQKYDSIDARTRTDITVATARQLAKMYIKKRNAKRTSTESTPMSFKSELPASALGLLLDTDQKGKARDEEVIAHSNQDYEGNPDISTTTGNTRRTVHPPAPIDWPDRVSAQRMRDSDLWKFNTSTIPDQGVVFVDRFPWDTRAASSGLNREKEGQEGSPPTPPPKDYRPSVVVQSPRSRMMHPTRRSMQLDPLVIDHVPPDEPITNSRARVHIRTRFPSLCGGANTIPEPKPPPSTTGRGRRGFSMPAVSAIRMITPGVAETDEYHRKTMVERLMRNVRERLSQPYEFPEGFKQSVKPDSGNDKKYSGTSKFKDLETWLVTVTNRFALSRLGGPSTQVDRLRVDFLQSWLEGEALDWYNRHVVGSNRAITYWSFCDVLEGLYDRFIHASSMQDAREGFRKVTYSAANGIQSFYDTLLEHTQNMSAYPDDYSILELFLTGIPPWMASNMFEDFGLSPESNTLDDFVATAKAIEQRGKTKTYYEIMRRNVRGTTSGTNNRAMPKGLTLPRTPWKVDKGEPGDAVAKPVRFTRPSPRYPNKGAKPPARPQHQHRTSTPKRQATASDQCFNCSKTRHFSSNCPFPRKPKKDYVRAARSTMDGEEEGDADDEYRMSEVEEKHEGDKESVTPLSEPEYTEI